MRNFFQDLRYGFRMLRKSPGFTAVAVITLALGIGGNTAIFSLVNAVLLRPLPYPDPSRLLFISEAEPMSGAGGAPQELGFSLPDTEEVERDARSFANIGWYDNTRHVYTRLDGSEQIDVTYATHGLLEALGVQPYLGERFTAADDQAGAGHTALISYSFWQTRLGGDPSVLGRSLTIDGKVFSVAGVLPRDFWWFRGGTVWLPMGAWRWRDRDDHWAVFAVGRLKPGVSSAVAQAELNAIASQLRKQYPQSNARISMRVLPLNQRLVGNVRPALLLLLAAVGFVLLICCVNVANLLLARASVRQREIAIRTALGAPVARIVRQLLTESVLLAFLGGAAGLALAKAAFGLLLELGGDRLPRGGLAMDHTVLWFTVAISALAGLAFGLLPAFRIALGHSALELREGRTFTAGTARAHMRNALMLAEVAISVVLLITAGLLIKSFARLRGVDPGFDPHQLLSLNISLPHGNYRTEADKIHFEQRALEEVLTIPGVRSASMARALPTEGDDWGTWYWAEGEPQPLPGQWPVTYSAIVTPGFFSNLEVPLLAGRPFAESDNQYAEPVVIVNETFAHRHWREQNPIGKHIHFPLVTPGTRTVVGMVTDMKNDGLAARAHEQVFIPYSQPVWFAPYGGSSRAELQPLLISNLNLLCRTDVLPLTLANPVKRKLQEIDPSVSVSAISTMDEVLNDAVSDRHFSVVLLELFSVLGLLLAAVGIYGVISFAVSQRTHEIGIRMALGARVAQVQWMVVSAALKTVLLGLAVGAAVSLLGLRVISSLLFQVRYADPEVIASAAAVLAAVGCLAAFVPARRAAKVDPMAALRYE